MLPWRGNTVAVRCRITAALIAPWRLLGGPCRGRHGGDHRPQRPPRTRPSIPAGRRAPATPNRRAGSDFCSVATPDQFFEQRRRPSQLGLHPVHRQPTNEVRLDGKEPVGELETVHVDLPVGLSVNPGATERCALATFEAGASGCPLGSQVGESEVTVAPPPLFVPLPPTAPLTKVPVYNVDPAAGRTRPLRPRTGRQRSLPRSRPRLGQRLPRGVHDQGAESAADPGWCEGLILQKPAGLRRRAPATAPSSPRPPPASARPTPVRRAALYSTYLLAGLLRRRGEPGLQLPESAEPPLESPIPPGTSPKECDIDPLRAGDRGRTGTTETNSPAGASVEVDVPHIIGADEQDSSDDQDGAR